MNGHFGAAAESLPTIVVNQANCLITIGISHLNIENWLVPDAFNGYYSPVANKTRMCKWENDQLAKTWLSKF